MNRLLIADDHGVVRRGLKQLLAGEEGLMVAAEAAQGGEVLEQLRHAVFELLVMDMSMPGISGLDLIRRVKAEKPGLPILVLSMHNETQLVARALKAGAAGYVAKDSDPDILLAAIRKILGGGRFIDPALVDKVVFGAPADEGAPQERLSDREYEVLQLLAKGLSLVEIGDRLHVSSKTISTHKTRLMQKLGLENNADLLRYAREQGLGGV